jgi:RNA polymerase sigma factor (sigma-70 family)
VSGSEASESARHARALALVDQYSDELAAHAVRLGCTPSEAEDAADHAFLEFLKRDPDADPIKNERAWLHTVTARAALKILARHDRIRTNAVLEHLHQWAWAEPEIAFEAKETLRALEQLDPAMRHAVVQDALGFSIKEIAEDTAASVSAVKKRIQRGRERLRRMTGRPKPEKPSATSERRSE